MTRAALLAGALLAAGALAPAAEADWTASSTSYSPCSAGTIMADGSRVRFGSVASNRHPLGTRLTLTRGHRFNGERRFTVRDRIGYGSDLDFWTPSCAHAWHWGRRAVTYRLGWPAVGRLVGERRGLGAGRRERTR